MSYKILWHGHVLREYDSKERCYEALEFFSRFLLKDKLELKENNGKFL